MDEISSEELQPLAGGVECVVIVEVAVNRTATAVQLLCSVILLISPAAARLHLGGLLRALRRARRSTVLSCSDAAYEWIIGL